VEELAFLEAVCELQRRRGFEGTEMNCFSVKPCIGRPGIFSCFVCCFLLFRLSDLISFVQLISIVVLSVNVVMEAKRGDPGLNGD
jgi:hypothetical protein